MRGCFFKNKNNKKTMKNKKKKGNLQTEKNGCINPFEETKLFF